MRPAEPLELGRSIVLADGHESHEPWATADRLTIDQTLLADPTRLAETVHDLTRRNVNRITTVFVLDVDPEELNAPQTTDTPPYELGGEFTFLRERLTKLIWHN